MSAKSKIISIYTIIVLIIYIVSEYSFMSIYNQSIMEESLFYNFYISPQKMLFNNTILFSVFLYLNRCEYLNTMVAIRYNRAYNKIIISKTLLICSIFVCYLYILYFISIFIFKIPIEVHAFFYIPCLFFFFLKINAIYNFIYSITSSYVLSFFFIVLEGFILLISYIGLGFVGINATNIINLVFNPFYCATLSCLFNIFVIILLQKRDIL